MHLTIPAATLALAALAAARDRTKPDLCPCGYTVNASGTPSERGGWAMFTEIFESDFLHVGDLRYEDDLTWIPQEYETPQDAARGPFGQAVQTENVITNPIRDPVSYNGPGVRAPDPGLQLWVRKDQVYSSGTGMGGTSAYKMVPTAEIVSARDDILYGSFRIGMRTTPLAGTCGAFFFYGNDSNEIDIELLSGDQPAGRNAGFVNLVTQKQKNDWVNIKPDSDNHYNHSLALNPSLGYHEYRFDWLPDRVDFYVDSKWISTIRSNVPKSPGAIHISHWSDGNDKWSGEPPEQNAVMTVSYVKAYFNSSNPEATNNSTMLCKPGEQPNSTCKIPNNENAPDPSGPHGKTFFFTTDREQSPPAPPGGSKDPITSDATSLKVSMTELLSRYREFLHFFGLCALLLAATIMFLDGVGSVPTSVWVRVVCALVCCSNMLYKSWGKPTFWTHAALMTVFGVYWWHRGFESPVAMMMAPPNQN